MRLAFGYTDAETGFVYLRARYYDPSTGQFISRDPLTAMTGAPYSYVDNNPLNGTDPLGLFCLLGHVNGNSGRCRGTNVATDLKVAGVVLSVAALSVTTLGLAAPELTVAGYTLAQVSFGISLGSSATSFAVAGLECPGNVRSLGCLADVAGAFGSLASTFFAKVGVTIGSPVLRFLSNVLGLGFSSTSLLDPCRPGKTIFEAG